jgi:hypothetical protein
LKPWVGASISLHQDDEAVEAFEGNSKRYATHALWLDAGALW